MLRKLSYFETHKFFGCSKYVGKKTNPSFAIVFYERFQSFSRMPRTVFYPEKGRPFFENSNFLCSGPMAFDLIARMSSAKRSRKGADIFPKRIKRALTDHNSYRSSAKFFGDWFCLVFRSSSSTVRVQRTSTVRVQRKLFSTAKSKARRCIAS